MKLYRALIAILLVIPLVLQGCSFLAGAAAGGVTGAAVADDEHDHHDHDEAEHHHEDHDHD